MRTTTTIDYIMTRKPAIVTPNENLDAVRHIFEKFGFHHIPVVEDGKLTGIVSYTDYLNILTEMCSGNTPPKMYKTGLGNMTVQDIMTKEVVCLKPSDTVEFAMSIFKSHAFHAMPVTEGDQRLVGILSIHDLMKVLEKLLAPDIDYAG